MPSLLRLLLLLPFCLFFLSIHAQVLLRQQPLSTPPRLHTSLEETNIPPLSLYNEAQTWYYYAIPAGLVLGGGALLNRLDWFVLNKEVRERWRYREYRARYVDDVLQFLPMTCAISWDITHLIQTNNWHPLAENATSIALMVGLVHGIKAMEIELRPDNSTWNSFPSGHTATAFVGAELLRQRLGSQYWYISVLGYAAATGTAYLRIYHNRHWLGDTLAGAGIGILSAWLGKTLTQQITKRR